jgi:hypothetical protein
MPIEYDIIEDKKLVLAKGSGVITAIDAITHLDRLAADNRYTSPMKKLVDYRLVEDIKITSEEAKGIAHKKQSLSSTLFFGEICAFVSQEDVTYGTSRVHQALSEGSSTSTKVFRQIENAVGWLDITLDMLT